MHAQRPVFSADPDSTLFFRPVATGSVGGEPLHSVLAVLSPIVRVRDTLLVSGAIERPVRFEYRDTWQFLSHPGRLSLTTVRV